LLAGLIHQALSVETREKANRVLIASRLPIAPLKLRLPGFDHQLQANVLGVKILGEDISLLGLRMPWYMSTALVTSARNNLSL